MKVDYNEFKFGKAYHEFYEIMKKMKKSADEYTSEFHVTISSHFIKASIKTNSLIAYEYHFTGKNPFFRVYISSKAEFQTQSDAIVSCLIKSFDVDYRDNVNGTKYVDMPMAKINDDFLFIVDQLFSPD